MVAGQTPKGGGTAFKITPTGVYTVIHRFDYQVEGIDPRGALILGTDGNFYGTTYAGGNGSAFGGGGTVFKMTPAGATTLITNFSSVGVYAPCSRLPASPKVKTACFTARPKREERPLNPWAWFFLSARPAR